MIPSLLHFSNARWLVLSMLFPSVFPYTWFFEEDARQCGNLTVNIQGTDGVPPFEMLIVPMGFHALESGVDPRQIITVSLPVENFGRFKLPYAEHSEFVAVVSDATGFGSGGTSVAIPVGPSDDSSCLDMTAPGPEDDFYFDITPPNQLVQCQEMLISWNPLETKSTPGFIGVIPGGQSFKILPETTSGFKGTLDWKPSIREGTTLVILGGDERRQGNAGRIQNIVMHGQQHDKSCLSGSSPSSTRGPPAGTRPTGAPSPAATKVPGKSSMNITLIAGAVAGGVVVVLICVVGLLCRLSRRRKPRRGLTAVDLTAEHDEETIPGISTRPIRAHPWFQHDSPEPSLNPLPRSMEENSRLLAIQASQSNPRLPLSSHSNRGVINPQWGSPPKPRDALQPMQMYIVHTDKGPVLLPVDDAPPPAYHTQQLGSRSHPAAGRVPLNPKKR